MAPDRKTTGQGRHLSGQSRFSPESMTALGMSLSGTIGSPFLTPTAADFHGQGGAAAVRARMISDGAAKCVFSGGTSSFRTTRGVCVRRLPWMGFRPGKISHKAFERPHTPNNGVLMEA